MKIIIEVKNIDKIKYHLSVLEKIVEKSLLSLAEEQIITDTISIMKQIEEKIGFYHES